MTTVYLAFGGPVEPTLAQHAKDGGSVDLLVAYPYWRKFEKHRHLFNIRKLCIDSGAYTAFKSGKVIDFASFLDFCKTHQADDVFGLDVVGDPGATRRNLEAMWAEGVDAIPVWRIGESWEQLRWAAGGASKIAFARTGSSEFLKRSGWSTEQWLQQAFTRVWPKRVHGLAMASWDMLKLLPWHSVDASTWELGPLRYGTWAGYTGKQMYVNTKCRDLRGEILEYQKRAAWAAARWKRELALLGKP